MLDVFENTGECGGVCMLFRIVKGVAISVLVYETVKSFRKYSRRL